MHVQIRRFNHLQFDHKFEFICMMLHIECIVDKTGDLADPFVCKILQPTSFNSEKPSVRNRMF